MRIAMMKGFLALFLFGGVAGVLAQNKLTNELIWGGESPFRSKSVDVVRSMNDGVHFTTLEANEENEWEIVKYSFETYDKVGVIAAQADVNVGGEPLKDVSSYSFNRDETKLLLVTKVRGIYRRSFSAVYYVHDTKSKKTEALSDKDGKQMLAEFSPDGKKVAFVRENNIFIKFLDSGEEIQITEDGEQNKIINGSTDWVYEEEFAIAKGFQWSSGSDYVAYMKFHEQDVPEFQMALYGPLYPYQYTFKYPKAGEANSVVDVYVYHIGKKRHTNLDVTLGKEIYIPRINWTQDEHTLLVQRMNRHQNELEYVAYTMEPDAKPSSKGYTTESIYRETSKTYIEIDDDLIFTEDGKSFIRTSEQNGFNHIYRIGLDGKVDQVTQGNWDVIEFKGLDAKNNRLFYLSAEEGAMYKTLYAINLSGKGKKKLSTQLGSNDAFFSKGMKYFINYYSNANTPSYITLHKADGSEIKVLEDNAELKETLTSYDLPKKEFIKVPSAEKGTELNAWMIKPKDFDPNKQYPVYLFVYGGPGHNTVADSYGGSNYLWHCYLAQQGYIVLSVDPRGTMYRGEAFKKSTYLQLGKLETEDMIATAKWLQGQAYVDGERIGVQGWSYGGYMSSLCMTKGADFFAMGIAVAPVTNWRFYDTIYTERFMRTPQENASGYDDNSPINHVDKMKGPYLLVHGSADDNVHHQNTMEMITALVKANKQFDMFLYPNKNHGIYGGNTRLHLYNKMTNFIQQNL